MTQLVKIERLYELTHAIPEETGFVFNPDEGNASYLYISPEDWIDMGAPKTLTVTVEPNDKLDGDYGTRITMRGDEL